MRLVAVRETVEGERRVAITPETAKGFKKLKVDVTIEAGAGAAALCPRAGARGGGAARSGAAARGE